MGDVYLLRTDAAGEILWEKTYGGEGYDAGQSISETGDGNLLIAGTTTSFGAQGMDAYLLKVDRDGKELWSRTYGGPLDEMVGVVGQMPDGSYILGGNIVDPNDLIADPGAAGYGGFAGRSNLYLLKVDGDGNELWSRAYDSEDNVLAASGTLTPDGGLLALVTITRYPDPDDDIQLLRLDGEGTIVWSRTWEEGSSTPTALVRTSDGNYLIAASYAPLEGNEAAKEDFLFIKVDPQGNEIWRNSFGDPELIDYGVELARASDGGYVTVGEQTRDRNTWQGDVALVKVDEKGHLLWQQTWPASHTMFSRVVQHPDGGFVIAGATFQEPVFKVLLVKTDSRGAVGEPSSAPDRSTVAGEIGAGIQELAAQGRFSGAVLVAQDGEPILKQAYGQADRALDLPNQVDTKFNLGSMDKMFTAVAIMQLVEQGRLALDDVIADHLPDYPNQEVAKAVTIHQSADAHLGPGGLFRERSLRRGSRSDQESGGLFTLVRRRSPGIRAGRAVSLQQLGVYCPGIDHRGGHRAELLRLRSTEHLRAQRDDGHRGLRAGRRCAEPGVGLYPVRCRVQRNGRDPEQLVLDADEGRLSRGRLFDRRGSAAIRERAAGSPAPEPGVDGTASGRQSSDGRACPVRVRVHGQDGGEPARCWPRRRGSRDLQPDEHLSRPGVHDNRADQQRRGLHGRRRDHQGSAVALEFGRAGQQHSEAAVDWFRRRGSMFSELGKAEFYLSAAAAPFCPPRPHAAYGA